MISNIKRKPRFLLAALAIIVAVLLISLVQYLYPGWFRMSIADGTLQVHFIDVGQGDAALLITPEGQTMLIDAGPNASEETLINYLRYLGVKSIDYLVLTHPHEDHIGGADCVIRNFTVKAVLLPDVNHTAASYERLLDAIYEENCEVIFSEPGYTFACGEVGCTLLGPLDCQAKNLNNVSIVLRIEYGDTAFLFTGDAEQDAEQQMIAAWTPDVFACDVLKVGHHGSSTSSGDDFLSLCAPSYAVISCGRNNDYGHPHKAILRRLEARHITVYRTDQRSTIVIRSDGTAVTIEDEAA